MVTTCALCSPNRKTKTALVFVFFFSLLVNHASFSIHIIMYMPVSRFFYSFFLLEDASCACRIHTSQWQNSNKFRNALQPSSRHHTRSQNKWSTMEHGNGKGYQFKDDVKYVWICFIDASERIHRINNKKKKLNDKERFICFAYNESKYIHPCCVSISTYGIVDSDRFFVFPSASAPLLCY